MFKEIKLDQSRQLGDGAKSASLFDVVGATGSGGGGGSSGGSSSGGSSGNSSVSFCQSFSNMLNARAAANNQPGGWSPHIPGQR